MPDTSTIAGKQAFVAFSTVTVGAFRRVGFLGGERGKGEAKQGEKNKSACGQGGHWRGVPV